MSLMFPLLLASAEKVLNGLLARDPAAPSRLARLAGRRLSLRLERPRFNLLVHFDAHGLHLLRQPDPQESDSDVVVELDAESLGALLGGESVERLMFSGRLSVRGRIPVLEEARTLLMDLDLDWEGAISQWLGDVPAHQLAEGLRHFGRWGLRSHRELTADLREYLFEEARVLPGRQQLAVLRDHLTELEVATDRLEARLTRLVRLAEQSRKRATPPREETPT
ncbi:SCP2 sterol-binding domain-containing protein [Halomonas shantousis]